MNMESIVTSLIVRSSVNLLLAKVTVESASRRLLRVRTPSGVIPGAKLPLTAATELSGSVDDASLLFGGETASLGGGGVFGLRNAVSSDQNINEHGRYSSPKASSSKPFEIIMGISSFIRSRAKKVAAFRISMIRAKDYRCGHECFSLHFKSIPKHSDVFG
uniref:Uncharacterized protein n=1 Tax=Romanomermis culicivorax TaxID=13658 RepID=A0A915L6F0_ROMCU